MGVLQMQLATTTRDVDAMISKENMFESSDGVFHPSSRVKDPWYTYNIPKGDQVKMMKVQPGETDNVIHSNAKEFDKFDGVVQPNIRDKYKRYDPNGKVEGDLKIMKVFPRMFREKMLKEGWVTRMADISDIYLKCLF